MVVLVVLPKNSNAEYGPVEGVFTNLAAAQRSAEICDGEIYSSWLDLHNDRLNNQERVYIAGIKISTGEIIKIEARPTIREAPEGDFHEEVVPEHDAIYAYVWATDPADARELMEEIRKEYVDNNG